MEESVEIIPSQVYIFGMIDSIVSRKYLSVLSDYPAINLSEEFDDQEVSDRVAFFEVPKLVFDRYENNLQKLVNVYSAVLEDGSGIVMLIKGTADKGYKMYLGAIDDKVARVRSVARDFANTFIGNFPGSLDNELDLMDADDTDRLLSDALNIDAGWRVAAVSGVGSSRIEGEFDNSKFYQGIEKLLDTMQGKDFTAIFIANSLDYGQLEDMKAEYENIYSKLSPLVQKQITYTESQAKSLSDSVSEALSDTVTRSSSSTLGTGTNKGNSHTEGAGVAHTDTLGIGGSIGSSLSESVTNAVFGAISGGLFGLGVSGGGSHAETNTVGSSTGISGNYSHSVARSKNWSDTTSYGTNTSQSNQIGQSTASGKISTTGRTTGTTDTTSRGNQVTYQNKTIKNILDRLDENFKRLNDAENYGAFATAVYFVAPNVSDALMAGSVYRGIIGGSSTHLQNCSVNVWDVDKSKTILRYLQKVRHPEFRFTHDDVVTPATIVNTCELALQLGLPKYSVPGITVTEMTRFGRNVDYSGQRADGKYINLGSIMNMGRDDGTTVKINVQSLASHTFITGSTGSGKSNTVYQLLNLLTCDNCEDKKGIKFLVVEPAKGEYKDVFGNRDDVSVYGTNSRMTPLLRINPFSFNAKQIHVYEHMDRLVEIFNVCWPMYAAMPAVLKNAIEKAYEDCGWDLVKSVNEYGNDLFPNFADVARNVKEIINSSEYDAENKGAYKGSLLTRLQSLTNGINGQIFCDKEISAEDLFDKNVVVDLSRVGSQETKSLIMGMLVLKLQEHRMTQWNGNVPLRHVTVLEEAHNLLKRSTVNATSESGNLAGKSVEMIANAIAEMRTYGEGFIIVDQAPGLLDMATIRNTNTKIIMRLPDQGDRELVGRAANLNDDQIKELVKLPCGVAAVYQNEWIEPVLCKVGRYDVPREKYRKPAKEKKNVIAQSFDQRLGIAELLSKGTKINDKIRLGELGKELKSMRLSSALQVIVLRMLQNPPKEPRMTKLAVIMDGLFPELTQKVRESYVDARESREWTEAVEAELRMKLVNKVVDDVVRRDIVQGIITFYLLDVENNPLALKEWYSEGGLK